MHVYFVGIGGSGLSPLAQLAIDCGYQVSGSDMQKSFGTTEVEKRGVYVIYDQSGTQMQELHHKNTIDWVIYTSACKSDSPELALADKLNIKKGKRDTFINTVLQEKNLKMLAIAGTHGKTTTTAMTVWMFKEMNIPVSYLIGSNISFGPAAHYDSKSEYFVYEADEFDHNFLNYEPFASIITNIDYDHPDTYPSIEEYCSAFEKFVDKKDNNLIMWSDAYSQIKNIRHGERIVLNPNKNDIENQIHFSEIRLPGQHNRENALLSVFLLSWLLSLEVSTLLKKVTTFPGTQRRFEKINKDVYSDYAHHPTEIAATLQLARELGDKIVVLYQPHQNLRQHQIKELYDDCFALADTVYWLPTFLSREDPNLPIISANDLSQYAKNTKVIVTEITEALKTQLTGELKDHKIIVAMGAGSIDSWIRENFKNI